jgi:hypothetical protein
VLIKRRADCNHRLLPPRQIDPGAARSFVAAGLAAPLLGFRSPQVARFSAAPW